MSLSRSEIHKGAVGLEQIAACFHDLASASDAVVNAQRKLSKALKDSASVKGCPDLAKNALNASAWMLDALIESDAKYARTIEREYEVLSANLRRWFKKLAKDEREHDDFISIREAKIRHAGETYERRALKKDIAEEYGRYVEILNTFGAEMSSAQKQHADDSNVRHTMIMISSGACLARLADAAWLRTCDSLRRCAEGVGNVGAARAWCESGLDEHIPVQHPNPEPYTHEAPESTRRPLPDPVFRPPSYNASSVQPAIPDLRPPPNRQGLRKNSDVGESNRNLAEPAQNLPTRTTPRVVESSAGSDLSLGYYSSVAGEAADRAEPSSSISHPEAVPQEGMDRRARTAVDGGGPSWSSSASKFGHHSPPVSPRTPSTGPQDFREQDYLAHRVDPAAESFIAMPRHNPARRSASPRGSSPSSGRNTSHALGRANNSPVLTEHVSENLRLSNLTPHMRSVTPNISAKQSTWVGKGLRRLSMPTFASAR